MTYKDLIDYYERDSVSQVVDIRPLSVRIPAVDLAFSQAVADFFRTTRAGFVQNLLGIALTDFFNSLSNDDRLTIAKASHEIYLRDLQKACSDVGEDVSFHGCSKWLGMALAMNEGIKE